MLQANNNNNNRWLWLWLTSAAFVRTNYHCTASLKIAA